MLIRSRAIDNLSAGEVASLLHTSRRNLERRFRSAVGRTVLEEIHRTRIKQAKQTLRDYSLSIKRVAMLSGFRTLDRFVAIFTRHTGMTPSAYRQRYAGRPDLDPS